MSIIRLPLLIHDDGTYTTLHDSIRMDFEPCPELPSPDIDQQNSSTARLTELIADLCIASNTTSNTEAYTSFPASSPKGTGLRPSPLWSTSIIESSNENQGGSVAVALVSNTGESFLREKEARRLFEQSVPCPWPIILDRSATRRRIGRPTTFKNYSTKLSMVHASETPHLHSNKRRHTVRNI